MALVIPRASDARAGTVGEGEQDMATDADAGNASIWLLIAAALLIGFSTGYTLPRWLQGDTLTVVELDRRTALNLEQKIMNERGERP